MMLVPITREEALSVAVAERDLTGVGVFVTNGADVLGTMGDPLLLDNAGVTEAPEEVGALLIVALPELGGVKVGLESGPEDGPEEELGGGTSEVGILMDALPDDVDTGDAEDPTEPDGGNGVEADIPTDGVTLGVGLLTGGVVLGVSDGVGGGLEDGTIAEDVGMGTGESGVPEGTTPDDGNTPEGIKLGGRLLGTTTGPDAVGRRLSTPERMLDSTVGTADGGTSESTEDKILGRSGTAEETAGGTRPIKVGDAVGAVGPRLDGTIPGTSETIDDSRDGKSTRGELVAWLSDVGIAPELRSGSVGVGAKDSPVPNAVVMPMTMPELGRGSKGRALSEDAAALVGRTGSLGRTPVGATEGTGVGDASIGARTDESNPSRGPEEGDACGTL
jgi:hypothetical protein